jgi:2'-deoxynucleoside 5'-phosphate N-hydrolase
MKTTKIYFAGSIRGGRDDREIYRSIIKILAGYGEVLTEHIGAEGLTPEGEENLSDHEIYSRDLEWLSSCDIVVAEVTNPSLGVGFEIAKAMEWKKRVLCLYREQPGKRLSAMIAGCPGVVVIQYGSLSDIPDIIDKFVMRDAGYG